MANVGFAYYVDGTNITSTTVAWGVTLDFSTATATTGGNYTRLAVQPMPYAYTYNTYGDAYYQPAPYRDVYDYQPVPAPYAAPPQPAVTREMLDREAQRVAQQAEEYLAERAAAVAAARLLLRGALTEEQAACLDLLGYFEVRGGETRRTYRIFQGYAINVALMSETHPEEELQRYCAHPVGVPDEDAMLAQKLLIECDEMAFLAAANRHPARYPAHRNQPLQRPVPYVRLDELGLGEATHQLELVA